MEFQDRIATSTGDRDKRLAAYLAKLEELKEANALREVMEERIFLEFIRVNRDRINEYPLLEVEQRSITEILLRASGDHPGREFVKERINNFMLALGRFGKAFSQGDEAAAAPARTEVVNAETILIKAVQGAVYAASLVKDNFSDAIIRHFGEESLHVIDRITETKDFDEVYWKTYMEAFIKGKVTEAYEISIRQNRYGIFREGSFLVVRFHFDEVLSRLKGTDKEIQQTRIQRFFGERRKTDEGQKIRNFTASFLSGGDNPLTRAKATASEILYVASIAAIDAIGREFLEAYSPDAVLPKESEEADKEIARREFVKEQLLSLCVGGAMVGSVVRRDFALALKEFDAKETEVIRKVAGNFESGRLEKALLVILEVYFTHLLRGKGEAEGAKIQVRTTRVRRALKKDVDRLGSFRLNRIRRKQIWEDDPDNPDMLLYRAKNLDEFKNVVEVLQLEENLKKAVYAMWSLASFKVDFLVLINLAAVGKVTTNLPQRIAEILSFYGIVQARPANAS